jgi:hypothetical protein
MAVLRPHCDAEGAIRNFAATREAALSSSAASIVVCRHVQGWVRRDGYVLLFLLALARQGNKLLVVVLSLSGRHGGGRAVQLTRDGVSGDRRRVLRGVVMGDVGGCR